MGLEANPKHRQSRRDLAVVFEIDLSPGTDCPLVGIGGKPEAIRHQLVDEMCHTDTTFRAGTGKCPSSIDSTRVVHASRPVEDACPCVVFGTFACVPELLDSTENGLIVETYLSDRDRLADLLEELKAVTNGVALRQLKRIDTGSPKRSKNTVTLDLFEMTEKQREAVTTAVESGYYATPQEISLGELADQLDISKSTLSHHLNAVESKLAISAFADVTSRS